MSTKAYMPRSPSSCSRPATHGGSANLSWIRLGHASDDEIKDMVDGGIKFGTSSMFPMSDPGECHLKEGQDLHGHRVAQAQVGDGKKAAACWKPAVSGPAGCHHQFYKIEGVTHNTKDRKPSGDLPR